MLGEITVGVANTEFWVSLFQTFKERPTHDSHEGFRFERLASLDFELDLAAVQCLVTGLTQRDEIVRRIAPVSTVIAVTGKSRMTASTRDMCAAQTA